MTSDTTRPSTPEITAPAVEPQTRGARARPRGTRPKRPRRDAMEASAPVPRRPATAAREALDGAWDIEMTRLLREAAEIREERDRARLSEDTILAQRETTALLDAIRTRGLPRVKRYILRPSAGRRAGPTQATP